VKGLVYQLVVEAVRLPDWFPASPTPRPPDVEVTLTVGPSGADPFAQRLSYPGLATVAIADGSRVDIELADRVGPDAVDLLLAGPVLGVVLHQRGNLVQHASAVRHEGHALVFTGGSTWGKSTTAAALYRHGFALVADDVVPLTVSAGAVTTMPGYPASKLWPDAAEALGLDVDAMPPIGLEGEKRRLDTPRGFLTRCPSRASTCSRPASAPRSNRSRVVRRSWRSCATATSPDTWEMPRTSAGASSRSRPSCERSPCAGSCRVRCAICPACPT
jgi:hypothetical protein